MQETTKILEIEPSRTLEVLVANKLNLDTRSCTFILKNASLVERIINEQPIRLKEFCNNIGISRNVFNKYFIETKIISSFQTTTNKGIVYIFANEFWDNYEKADFKFLEYSDAINLDFSLLNDSLQLIIHISYLFNIITPRHQEILLMHYIHKKSLHDISYEYNLSKDRVSQIVFDFQKRLNKHLKNTLRQVNYSKKHFNELHTKVKILEHQLNVKPEIPKEPRNPMLDKFIDDIEFSLSNRTINSLKGSNILTIEDLIRLNKKDLWKFRNLGSKSIKEIEEFVFSNNLNFGYED